MRLALHKDPESRPSRSHRDGSLLYRPPCDRRIREVGRSADQAIPGTGMTPHSGYGDGLVCTVAAPVWRPERRGLSSTGEVAQLISQARSDVHELSEHRNAPRWGPSNRYFGRRQARFGLARQGLWVIDHPHHQLRGGPCRYAAFGSGAVVSWALGSRARPLKDVCR